MSGLSRNFVVLASLAVLLSGCSDDPKGPSEEDPHDDSVLSSDVDDGSDADVGAGAPVFVVPEIAFNASVTQGVVPLLVNFTFDASAAGEGATWTLEFGDANDSNGTGLPGEASHTYEIGGEFVATLEVAFPSGDSVARNVTINVTVPDGSPSLPPPDPSRFEFGASLGCVSEHGQCGKLGPDASGTDGHWQAFDERYWGYTAVVTESGNQLHDTDCKLYAADHTTVLADGSNVDQPCKAEIPMGTAWIYINSWGEPSTGITLEIIPTVAEE